MKYVNNLTKLLLGIWFILFVYSIIAKTVPIYFFWESSFICWTFFFLALSSLVYNISKLTSNNTISDVSKISVLVFIAPVFFTYFFIFGMKSSKPFYELQEYIVENENLKNDVGEISQLSILPMGSYQSTKNSNGTFGEAQFNVILKGKIKYKKISAHIVKEIDSSGWRVIDIY